MAENYLPCEIILKILTRLPIKSLIRFCCVSKRWRRSILSDPKFAKLHFQQTLSRRLLLSGDGPQLESLELDTSSFGGNSMVRRLNCPFKIPDKSSIAILGSCNGLLCAGDGESFYIWNPSTGFFRKLPDPGFTSEVYLYGFGYVSATDDYKVLFKTEEQQFEVLIFSLRADTWKRIWSPLLESTIDGQGALLHEALHWLGYPPDEDDEEEELDGGGEPFQIVSFDFAMEKFRKMKVSTSIFNRVRENSGGLGLYRHQLGVSSEGFLFIMRHLLFPEGPIVSIDFWVMREYGKIESWSNNFSLKVPTSEPIPGRRMTFNVLTMNYFVPILLVESGAVIVKRRNEVIKADREEEKPVIYMLESLPHYINVYEESLICLGDYDGWEEDKVKRLKIQHKAQQS